MKKTLNTRIVVFVVALSVLGVYLFMSMQDPISQVAPRETSKEKGVQIIAFGDSLTAGYGLPSGESYPAQLEAALRNLGHSVTIINSGVSGETTRGNLERASFIRKQNPDIVLLGIGGNDALRLLPVEETRKNIEETVSILKSGENAPVVVLLAMQAPINVGLQYKNTFDDIYKEVAEEQDILLLPFITFEVFLDTANKLPDGIHLNKTGYKKIVENYLTKPLVEIIKQIEG